MRDADISRYSKRRPVFICRPSATSTLAPSAKTAPSNAYVEAEICADEKKKKKGKRDPLYQGRRPRLFYGLSLAHSLSLSATLFPSLLRPSLHDGITACTRGIDCAVVRTPSGPSEWQEKEDKKGATAGSIRKKTRDKKHKEFAHVLERSAREQQEDNRPYCVERPCAADSHARACWHAGATCSAEPSVLGRGSRPLSLSISRVAVSFLSISFICKKKKKRTGGRTLRYLKSYSAALWPLRIPFLFDEGRLDCATHLSRSSKTAFSSPIPIPAALCRAVLANEEEASVERKAILIERRQNA